MLFSRTYPFIGHSYFDKNWFQPKRMSENCYEIDRLDTTSCTILRSRINQELTF